VYNTGAQYIACVVLVLLNTSHALCKWHCVNVCISNPKLMCNAARGGRLGRREQVWSAMYWRICTALGSGMESRERERDRKGERGEIESESESKSESERE